ncbi:hypothetical protein BGX31_006046 [Mortierella sp. GBA43]|nr:hypothetical protein BGX31_006046 [Mortierella sp. GBA43]
MGNFTLAATAAVGLTVAGLAYQYTQQKKETGRESWNDKRDVHHYDFIVLGAEDPDVSVLVLEAGEDMDGSFLTKMPMGFAQLYQSRHDWKFKTVPQIHANNRVLDHIRGRMLGGCSMINNMQYTRGPRSDYDEWVKTFGNPGWSYEEVLPYFMKSECFHDPTLDHEHPRGPRTPRVFFPEFDTYESEYHGTDGPWHLSFHHLYPAAQRFIQANMDEGIPRLKDPNGSSTLGVFRMQSMLQPNATRSSASTAFLGKGKVPGGKNRGTIRVVLKATVERIIMEERDGIKKATGAEFRDETGELRRVYVTREVLLSSGVFQSPALLLASGIGHQIHPSIPLMHELPGVGQNMTDHIGVGIVFKAPPHVQTLHTTFALRNIPKNIYKYYKHGTGPLSSQAVESGCFVRLEQIAPEFVAREKANGTWQERASGPDAPHVEILFPPCYVKADDFRHFPSGNYYTLIAVLLNPASKGKTGAQVTESSKGLKVEPVIDSNFLADEFDMRVMKEAVKFARRLGKRMQQDPELGGVECSPGEDVVPNDDDAAMEAFIRQNCTTYFHSVGTCSMGPSDNPEAVVDTRLRVHGIESLRVIDSSVIPKVIAGHTAAATVMIAEKAADMIKEDWLHKPSGVIPI